METASYKQFLSSKIHYLEEQRQQLRSLVDKQVDKVLHASKKWPEGDDQGNIHSFKEISQLIEDTALFLTLKCAEMTGMGQDSVDSDSKPDVGAAVPLLASSKKTSGSDTRSSSEMKDWTRPFQEMEARIKQLTDKQSKMEMKQDARLEAIEHQLQTVNNAQLESENLHHSAMEEIRKQKEEKKMEELKEDVESVKVNLKNLRSHADYLAASCNYDKQIEGLGERMEKLEAVVPSAEDFRALKDLVKKSEQGTQSSKSDTSVPSSAQVQILERKLEEMEKKVDGLQPTKLQEVVQDVKTLVPKVAELEVRCKKRCVGFSASLQNAYRPVKGQTVYFKNTICNTGNHFNPSTGVFTAPVDGMYGMCITSCQEQEGEVSLNVKQNNDIVCVASTHGENDCASDFGVIDMRKQDRLFVVVDCFEKRPRLSFHTTFLCFLINEYI